MPDIDDFDDWVHPREEDEGPSGPRTRPAEAAGGFETGPAQTAGRFEPPPAPPAPPMPIPPASRRRGTAVVAAVVAALVFLAAGVGLGWGLFRPTATTSPATTRGAVQTPLQLSPSTGSTGGALSVPAIVAKVEPGIVDINTYLDTSSLGSGSFGAPGPSAQPLGAGTGMVLTSSGEILTNNHVIEGATNIEVTIAGRAGHFYARVVGVDPTDDVALIQLQNPSNLSTVTLADSSSVRIGDRVVAIGNALGQGGTPTVTQGSVTALGRTITVGGGPGGPEHLHGLIQTDAPISPGDSGGALVNSSGQVVGIITAAQRSIGPQPAAHVGYAIAMNSAAGVVNQIRSGDASATVIIGQPGFMGVEVRNLDAAAANRLGLGVTRGALVTDVFPGTPAQRAGVTGGSVITAVDGKAVTSAHALGPIIHTYSPGDQIKLTWVDLTGTHTATLQLISGPAV
jgi:S1-C subfamily serine protease